MKSIGNKLIILAFGLATASMTLQAAEEPKLIKFEPHTPAKAQQVNSNFNEIKRYSKQTAAELAQALDALQTRVAGLETENPSESISEIQNAITTLQKRVAKLEKNSTREEYTIPVWGDCAGECSEENLIGYAKSVPSFLDTRFTIKTELGRVSLRRPWGDGNYFLETFDEVSERSRDLEFSLRYPTSSCTGDMYLVTEGKHFFFTKPSTTGIAYNQVLTTNNSVYVIEEGTQITTNQNTFFNGAPGNCEEDINIENGTPALLAKEINEVASGTSLKPSYSSIKIEGYDLN